MFNFHESMHVIVEENSTYLLVIFVFVFVLNNVTDRRQYNGDSESVDSSAVICHAVKRLAKFLRSPVR